MAERIVFTVTDPIGLHARPATYLVNTSTKFDSKINIVYEGKPMDLKSIMGVMALSIPSKATVEIIAEGEDEKAAITHIAKVIKEQHIGE